jgi:hypothetical protein
MFVFVVLGALALAAPSGVADLRFRGPPRRFRRTVPAVGAPDQVVGGNCPRKHRAHPPDYTSGPGHGGSEIEAAASAFGTTIDRLPGTEMDGKHLPATA